MANDNDYIALLDAADTLDDKPRSKYIYAVWSKDDGSLNFYNREDVPQEGSTFEGREATFVWGEDDFDKTPWRISDNHNYESYMVNHLTSDHCWLLYETGTGDTTLKTPFGECKGYVEFDACGFEDWLNEHQNGAYEPNEYIQDFVDHVTGLDNPHIKSITVVDENIPFYNVEKWFAHCPNLTYVDMEKLDLHDYICFEMSYEDIMYGEGEAAVKRAEQDFESCFADCPHITELPQVFKDCIKDGYGTINDIWRVVDPEHVDDCEFDDYGYQI